MHGHLNVKLTLMYSTYTDNKRTKDMIFIKFSALLDTFP